MRNANIVNTFIAAIFSAGNLVKLVAITALATGFAYLNRGYLTIDLYEIGDFAANSLLIQHAKQFDLLVGNYSRVGFNHPGPAILYVLAWGEWLFHDCLGLVKAPFAGQILAEGVYSAFWIVMLATLLVRMYRSIVIACLALTLILTATIFFDYNILLGLWFPHLYYFPFATFVLALALLIVGRGDSLVILAISCGFLIHGHVSFVAICGIMLLGALAINYFQAQTNPDTPRLLSANFLNTHRPALYMVIVLFILFLSPLALETIRHFPGPIAKYRSFSAGNHHHSFSSALQFASNYWALGFFPAITAILALLFFANNNSAANGSATIVNSYRATAAALLLATIALLLYAMYGIDDLSFSYVGLFYYSAPAIGLAVMITSLLRWRRRATQITLAAIIVALALPYSIRQIAKPVGYAWHYNNTAVPEYYAKISALGLNLVLDLDTNGDWGKLWSTMTGIEIYALRQHGELPFCINKNWHILFTAAAQCTPRQLAAGTRYFVSTALVNAAHLQPSLAEFNDIRFYKIPPVEIANGQFDVASHRDIYANGLLISGWSNPDGDFAWSEGKRAILTFSVAKTTAPTQLEIELKAFLPSAKSQQKVEVLINDNLAGTLLFDSQHDRGKHVFSLPSAITNSGAPIVVQFNIEKPMSPRAAGLNDDMRLLGIGLYGIELKK